MNDNNLIKAQLWADVYGGTIKNGHSVAAATDRANEAVKEYEERFDVSDGGESNAELRRSIYLRDARIKQLEGREAEGHRLLIEGAEILQARDANIRELKDQLKEAEACIADLGDRLKEREATVGSLSNLLSEKDKKISALEERVKRYENNEGIKEPNPFASNLHPFVSENADKLAEASKDGGFFISNQIPINPSRRSGNTTRTVDAIIQALFNGKKVLVRDHYNSRERDRELLSKVEHRLVNDHGIKWSAVCMEVECLGGDVTIWLENRTGEANK